MGRAEEHCFGCASDASGHVRMNVVRSTDVLMSSEQLSIMLLF